MVGLDDGGENPFSFSSKNAITVRKIESKKPEFKTFTERAFIRKVDDNMYVRGPLGKGFYGIDENSVVIAGRTGAAPLKYAACKVGNKAHTKTFLGAKAKKELIFKEAFEATSRLHISTDDGSEGYHGTVVGLLKQTAETEPEEVEGRRYLLCGPEKMIVAVAEYLLTLGKNADYILCCIERYMKCAMGICGECSCGGWRPCVDGPVFPYSVLMKTKDFGHYKLDEAGLKVEI
jgi:dihydroorotate dehydrogenase electron transfer subunit